MRALRGTPLGNAAVVMLGDNSALLTVQHLRAITELSLVEEQELICHLPLFGGLAISNSTVPVSRSLILKRVKSMLKILSSGLQR